MRRTNRRLSLVVLCGSVAILGSCTSGQGDSSMSSARPRAAPSDEDLHRALLSREDIASVTDTSATDINQMAPAQASEMSLFYPIEGCAAASGSSGPSRSRGPWRAGVYYTFMDRGRGTDVVECVTTVDKLTFEEIAGLTRGKRYAPAPIGTDVIGFERDGGGGAIDRTIVIRHGAVVTVLIANRHSPVPATENLTRSQVDRLGATALGNLPFASDGSDRLPWRQCAGSTWPGLAGGCGTP